MYPLEKSPSLLANCRVKQMEKKILKKYKGMQTEFEANFHILAVRF